MNIHELIAPYTRRQHGLITHAQSKDAGVTRGMREHALQIGVLEHLYEGVYRSTTAPRSWHQSLLAACLATEGVASHRSAAAVWGLGGVAADIVEVSVVRPRHPRPLGVISHRSRDLVPLDMSRRQQIPVTSPLRLLVDLGAVAPFYVVRGVLYDGLAKRVFTPAGCHATLDRLGTKGRRGAGVLRPLLAGLPSAAGDVRHEYDALRSFGEHGLPIPVFQYIVVVNGVFLGKVDFAFVEVKVAVEFDGWQHYLSWEAIDGDNSRTGDLEAAGWLIIRVSANEYRQRPEVVMARILRVLKARAEQFGVVLGPVSHAMAA